ncbi:MAG: transglycosylase domain-containing protein [Rhodospirillales bacterium]|nr:transglycosylase domain-containing protein [Rhodospirillales bacterium]
MSRAYLPAGLTVAVALIVALVLASATLEDLEAPPESLQAVTGTATVPRILDRHGTPLSVTLQNDWNVHDIVPLHEIPGFLQRAFIHAEDKRFHRHGGADWIARAVAMRTNLANGRAVRGGSTITEQVVRILHPRPRTVWARWLEGFEAARLEAAFAKHKILEFYLNQVPYAANRRGVRQAAEYYFSRDLDTLSRKEMLALAVLVRSPSRLDLYRSGEAADATIRRLADLMVERGELAPAERERLLDEEIALKKPELPVSAPHFVSFVKATVTAGPAPGAWAATTLDAGVQRAVQDLLDRRLAYTGEKRVEHGAVLVVDNHSRGVLAWVVGGGGNQAGPRTHIDAVRTPRQPGSALKPLLYGLALDSGWTAATVIDDAPLAADVGVGLHAYQNYSRRFYGPISLRDALGNSLNIPALKALHFVGSSAYLGFLRELGFTSLNDHPDVYGDGLALGNGEVSLYELVQAYAALADGGRFRPLTVVAEPGRRYLGRQVLSTEGASLIADILSDPDARSLEFGRASVLNFHAPTAVKTGTSSDFRDVWAVGFDARHTVGVWMGNLDQTPSQGVTGSTGPAILLRSIFTELSRNQEPQPLYLSPGLRRASVCVPDPGSLSGDCVIREEWFVPGTEPAVPYVAPLATEAIAFLQPTPGLLLAVDPRLPPEHQAFEFRLGGTEPGDRVDWKIDGDPYRTLGGRLLWSLTRGTHQVSAEVWRSSGRIAVLDPLGFTVK